MVAQLNQTSERQLVTDNQVILGLESSSDNQRGWSYIATGFSL